MAVDDLFSEAFWEPDIGSTRGYEVIVRRMKDGKKTSREIEEYVKERAKVEASYAKSIRDLAKKLEGKHEMGMLGESILELRKQTETLATIHDTAAGNFTSLHTWFQSLRENQEKLKHEKESSLKRHQDNKLQNWQRTNQAKERYIQKCREFDQAQEANNVAKRSVQTLEKEVARLQKQEEKARDAMEQADIVYKSNIDTLDNARNKWEQEMVSCCQEFQTLEEQRIFVTRDLLWKYANIDSEVSVSQDECAEHLRLALERVDIDIEIQSFIKASRLGSVRPAQVLYENYYNKNEVKKKPMKPALPPPPLPDTTRGPAPPTPDGTRGPAPPIPDATRGKLIDLDDPYSTIRETQHVLCKSEKLNVTGNYTAKSPCEVSVNRGETVDFVRMIPGNKYVSIRKGNQCGVVPAYCVGGVPLYANGK